jgi:hypothetical protein
MFIGLILLAIVVLLGFLLIGACNRLVALPPSAPARPPSPPDGAGPWGGRTGDPPGPWS